MAPSDLGKAVMADTLSWDEIKRRHPDEYVVLVDLDLDRSTTTLLGGTVMNHGKDKAEMIRYLGTLNDRDGACSWTGEVRGRVHALVKADPARTQRYS